jgi:uncharacterized protein
MRGKCAANKILIARKNKERCMALSYEVGQSLVVSGLYRHPIKSCRGHAIEQGEIEARGFKDDREFMVVDPDGYVVTQREHPRMALIEPSVEGSILTLTAPGMPVLRKEYIVHGAQMKVDVWENICEAIDQGNDVAEWFSAYIEMPCRLVRMAQDFRRPVSAKHAVSEHDHVSFVDGYPFLIISEGSLADLNSRMEQPLPMRRFRPSIVIHGAEPFAEDTWRRIRIGTQIFELVKPCARCVMTTVNPDTTEMGKEPLRTLAKYRRGPDGGVLFGQNAIHHGLGTIHVGDTVEILAMNEQPLQLMRAKSAV